MSDEARKAEFERMMNEPLTDEDRLTISETYWQEQCKAAHAAGVGAERARLEQPCTWAVNQMRRAARTLELVAVGASVPADNTYSKGLDMCADALEKAVRQ